ALKPIDQFRCVIKIGTWGWQYFACQRCGSFLLGPTGRNGSGGCHSLINGTGQRRPSFHRRGGNDLGRRFLLPALLWCVVADERLSSTGGRDDPLPRSLLRPRLAGNHEPNDVSHESSASATIADTWAMSMASAHCSSEQRSRSISLAAALSARPVTLS